MDPPVGIAFVAAVEAASSTIACNDGWASATVLCEGVANSFWMVVVDPILGDPEPFVVDPVVGTTASATTSFDELGVSTGVSRCEITIAGKTALVGLESDGITRMLTPSLEAFVGSERETLVPVSDVAFDGPEFDAPDAPAPVTIREPE